jgi:putative oxidoreductase
MATGNCFLQRLFSTFPAGFPGIGLLILRLGAGVPLLYFAREDLLAAPDAAKVAYSVVKICAGILLLFGLWTPVAGGIAALAGLWTFFSQSWANHVYPLDPMFLGVLGASLALLGPGAWSVDARLFGRRLFVTRRPRRGPH